MAAPSFRSVGTQASGTGAVTPGMPTGWQVGDDLILICESNQTQSVTTPSGWAVLYASQPTTGGTNTTRLSTFYRKARTGDTAPTVADPGDHCVAIIAAFSGCSSSGATPFEASIGVSATATDSTSISFPSITTTVNDCLIVNIIADGLDSASARYSGVTNASLSSVTEQYDGGAVDGSGGGIGIFTGVKTTAGSTGSTTATLSSSAGQSRITLAIMPETSPVFITRAMEWPVPSGATSANVHAIGNGGNGANGGSYASGVGGTGGGSGAYAYKSGIAISGTVTANFSGDVYFKSGTDIKAASASGTTGGTAANSVGTTKYNGANGQSASGLFGAGGQGAGAAGPDGAGDTSGAANNSTTVSAWSTSYPPGYGGIGGDPGTSFDNNGVSGENGASYGGGGGGGSIPATHVGGVGGGGFGATGLIVVFFSTSSDSTPDAFTFTDITSASLSTVYTSNTITVSGIDTASAISISGGTYSVNGGSYTGSSGTVNNGDTVAVRVTSSGSFSTAVSAVLTIGGVSDTYTVTTLAIDTTPDAFTFTDITGASLSTVYTSNTITVSGINSASAISISGGTYSVNGGSYTGSSGTVNNGDTVAVRVTSSGSFSTAVSATLTIGGVSDTYTVTTAGPDTTPDAFTFTDVTNALLGEVYASNQITISGINSSASISISGGSGQYSKNGAAYTSSTGTVVNGDLVRVIITSSASYDTTVSTTLTVGGVSDTFSVTTNTDSTPGAFTFTDITGATPSTVYESAAITVSAINTGSTISISGGSGSYSINGGAYTTGSGTVYVGNTVKARVTSSPSYSTTVSTTVTIGGVSDTFSVTTISSGDTTPNAFTFTDVTGAATSTSYTSNTITVSGIDTASPVSVTGGTYSKNGGAFTSTSGTVNNGDTIAVRAVSSSSNSTAVSVVLTIGGITDTYTVTTSSGTTGLPRVALGKRGANSEFGLFISKPGINVMTATSPDSFLFSTSWTGAGVIHASGTITANTTVNFTALPYVPVVFCWVVYPDGSQGIKAMNRGGSMSYYEYWVPGLSEYQYEYSYDFHGYQEPLIKVTNSSLYMEKTSTWLGTGTDTGNSARYVVLNMKGGV